MRWAVRAAIVALIAWSGTVGALYLFRHELIYPFRNWPAAQNVSGLAGVRAETVTAADGVPLTVWTVPARPGRPVILYFMGNAGSLPSNGPRLTELVTRGYGVVALNYRGAGGAPGSPSQTALVADALTVYDLKAPDEIHAVLYGTSLGAALAVQVAARRPAAALILETPFARLCETAQHHYPFVPACLILHDESWDSVAAIGRITAPVLIQHGDADEIIPLSQGQRLFEAANEPKQMRIYPGGRHNDLRLHGAGVDIIAFLEGLDLR